MLLQIYQPQLLQVPVIASPFVDERDADCVGANDQSNDLLRTSSSHASPFAGSQKKLLGAGEPNALMLSSQSGLLRKDGNMHQWAFMTKYEHLKEFFELYGHNLTQSMLVLVVGLILLHWFFRFYD